ncbi:Any1p [Kluyveromyces lactis]|uniref:KLLA0D14509p n=1 Tax=Kluyveromyces lactis (strain ATCC 8585 / CBS 2359 / DSM 70799 / NBRC 1267 / NRRL Y-1140 / WM37) TaxID=284590 RepID=Q6CQT4_KLULA|nr:uncharacterized protein KLLA0_D14509g [Kluyveromyces lactis]CAH00801.1 KLLA0D14509p [Kluyveromyces lactis]|eukprot:XP_453705.1 uncharacterized protein KLLA0_D14509g [Kluyveromyces lactis]
MEIAKRIVEAAAEAASDDASEGYFSKIDQFYIPEWLTMQFVANNLISFTPLFSYGTTVLAIHKSQTSLGFSLDICATMLIASILRVSYYLITPYEITLLRQSIVMILIQLILLKVALNYRPEDAKYENLEPVETLSELLQDVWEQYFPANPFDVYSTDWKPLLKSLSWKNLLGFGYKIVLVCVYKFLKFFDPSFKRFKGFWQWNDDLMYWKFLLVFGSLQFFITLIISKVFNWESFSQWIGSLIGSLGLFIESLLPLPQISIFYKLKSVQGFKLIILVSWLCGDILKISYLVFGASNISVIFLCFGLFQMSLDIYIACQYIYYKYYYPSLRHDEENPEIMSSKEELELRDLSSLQKEMIL